VTIDELIEVRAEVEAKLTEAEQIVWHCDRLQALSYRADCESVKVGRHVLRNLLRAVDNRLHGSVGEAVGDIVIDIWIRRWDELWAKQPLEVERD
jgi:hypothetical protein